MTPFTKSKWLFVPNFLSFFLYFLSPILLHSANAHNSSLTEGEEAGPVAVCFANVNVSVGASCDVVLTPEMIDGGSFDPDGDPLSFSLDVTGPLTPGNYVVFMTVTAGGESNNCWSNVVVEDKTFPLAVCDAFINLSLDATGNAVLLPEMLDAGSTDNCALTFSFGSGQTSFDCTDVGNTYTVFLDVEDVGGNVNTCFSDVTITDPLGTCTNTGPVAVCIANVNVSVDASCEANLLPAFIDGGSFDPDGDPLTFSLDDSGPFSPGVYTVWLTVSDGLENNTCFSTITVEDKIDPVAACVNTIIVSIGPGGSTTITPAAIDDGSFDNCNLNLGFESGPTVTFTCDDVGAPFNLTLEATDDSGNTSFCTTFVSVQDPGAFCSVSNSAPVAVCESEVIGMVGPDCVLEIEPEAIDAGSFDPDDDDLTFTLEPAGPFPPGTYEVILTVSDGDLTSECVSVLEVRVPDNDGDGFGVCEGDCDDSNEDVYPGAPELCDGLDNDCDGAIDEPDDASTEFEWIAGVSLADLNNPSGNDGGYGDYTGLSASLITGSSYSITLTPGYAGATYAEQWRVYIDLNQNGIFEHPAERVAQVQGEGPQTRVIDIPSSSLTGSTRMRVIMSYGAFSLPCSDGFEGEIEDYTVNIEDCENTPDCIQYCETTAESTAFEWIQRVRIGAINNRSGNDGGYGNYTGLSTDVAPGDSYTIRLRPGFSGASYEEFWRVWVDWNQDGEFDPGSELAVEASGTGVIVANLEVPIGALSGSTRMRVAMQYNAFAEPCESFSEGEVEDYSLNVVASSALVVMPSHLQPTSNEDVSTDQPITIPAVEVPTFDESEEVLEMEVFPNPATSFVYLRMNSLADVPAMITLADQNGRRVWQQQWDGSTSQIQLDLTPLQLPAGVYMVSVNSGDNLLTKRLVINPN